MATPSARLLILLSLLGARPEWSGHDLADRLGVSTRTVRRDIESLRGLGYPVPSLKGPDAGYRLTAWSWAGIAGLLETFDADITIVEPDELKDACRTMARRYDKASR